MFEILEHGKQYKRNSSKLLLRSMKTIGAVVVILIVALGTSLILNYYLYTNNDPQLITAEPFLIQNASTTDPFLGLNLSVIMNTTSLQSGESIDIIISETNTLNTTNTVNAANEWQFSPLSLSPCGTLNYPMGLAIFQGYYTPSNVSTAETLELYKPGMYSCPMILAGITSYTFQPLSTVASVNAPYSIFNLSLASGVTASGYWTDNNSSDVWGLNARFSNFQPGIYTIAGGDEWGQLILLHFTVV